jgi:hypothetical protein
MYNLKQKYKDQRLAAGYRGIAWHFTYEEWITWWGDDILKRGRLKDQLVMARKNDQGAYHPGNVYKATTGDNVRESCVPRARSDANQMIKEIITCPHCGLSANKGNALRWHFENCKSVQTV